MLYLKKYFTEGLIQMAILLSLCGVKVDVGLEPYLPSSLHEVFMGPTSGLTPTPSQNLYNRWHPKSVDLDGFFTARRLLGWVSSVNRFQVPPVEVETWLVQREPDPAPVQRLDQASLLDRAPAGIDGDTTALSVELQVRLHNQEEEEKEENQEDTQQMVEPDGSHVDRGEKDLSRAAEDGAAPQGSTGHIHTEFTGNEADRTSVSLQECLRLLDETFTFTEQQLMDACDKRGNLEHQTSDRQHFLCPHFSDETVSVDMELHWQDLLAIMEPENTNSEMTSRDDTLNSTPAGTFDDVRSKAVLRNYDSSGTETRLGNRFIQHHPQTGVLGNPSISELVPALLPLTPSAELDDHSPAQSTEASLNSPHVDGSPPDHTDLLEENPMEVFSTGFHVENQSFNINLLTQDVHGTEPQTLSFCDIDFHLCSPTPSRSPPPMVENCGHQELIASPPSVVLVDLDDGADEYELPSPINDILENATMLEEIRWLDLALEEGFSPEMVDRSEEEDYHGPEMGNTERAEDHVVFNGQSQNQPGRQQQDNKNEADSDSGLSLDFSRSPASPCVSEASSYSSSSLSTSSTSVSTVERRFTEIEETSLVHVEMEVTIKQEDLEEEEVGAVGGAYPTDPKKLFSLEHEDHTLFQGFPWLHHVGHNHTYNQPWSSISPTGRKLPSKHTKSAPTEHNVKPYSRSFSSHLSESKLFSRDEWRARSLKIPFSNELIVNLPVEEFNDLLTEYHFNKGQLNLIRDIRRRGKNKLAAQNCRKRKLDVLLGLEDNVSGLKRYRAQLLREKREAQNSLQEMKRQLRLLYQDVFSRFRDETGRPLDAQKYLLQFGPNGHILVAPRQQQAGVPQRLEKPSKKQKYKKK